MAASRYRMVATSLDMYRKVPADLMEGTKRGSFMSWLALISILTLFILETREFFTERYVEKSHLCGLLGLFLAHHVPPPACCRQVVDLQLDSSPDPRIRVNFNITMLDLRCEWAVVDVVSTLGTEQNVTAHIQKWPLDANGVRKQFAARVKHPKDITLKDETVTQSIEELHENGEDAVSLDEKTLQFARDENDYLFVDFFASWCNHCRDLAPTWEALAELMMDSSQKLGNLHPDDVTAEDYEKAEQVQAPVMIAKVDCVVHHDVCLQQEIRAYPTLRLFVDGKPWKEGDYRGHRTLLNIVEWLYLVEMEHKEHMDESERQLHVAHHGMWMDRNDEECIRMKQSS